MSCPFASLCLFLLYAAVSCYQCSASWKDASINRLTMCYFCSNSHFKDLCLKRLDLFILNVCLFALVWSYVCLFAPLFGWIEWTTFCPLYWARNYLTFVLPHFASFIFWRRFWSFARFQFFFLISTILELSHFEKYFWREVRNCTNLARLPGQLHDVYTRYIKFE